MEYVSCIEEVNVFVLKLLPMILELFWARCSTSICLERLPTAQVPFGLTFCLVWKEFAKTRTGPHNEFGLVLGEVRLVP
jgi:hypothetical protein